MIYIILIYLCSFILNMIILINVDARLKKIPYQDKYTYGKQDYIFVSFISALGPITLSFIVLTAILLAIDKFFPHFLNNSR